MIWSCSNTPDSIEQVVIRLLRSLMMSRWFESDVWGGGNIWNMQGRGSTAQWQSYSRYKMFTLHHPGLELTNSDTKGNPWWAAFVGFLLQILGKVLVCGDQHPHLLPLSLPLQQDKTLSTNTWRQRRWPSSIKSDPRRKEQWGISSQRPEAVMFLWMEGCSGSCRWWNVVISAKRVFLFSLSWL